MSRWAERPKPYKRPEPWELTSSGEVSSYIKERLKTGMDASLYFEMNDEYIHLKRAENERKKAEERITPADLQSHVGRPRKIRR